MEPDSVTVILPPQLKRLFIHESSKPVCSQAYIGLGLSANIIALATRKVKTETDGRMH